jgi:hypothetical protein
MLILTNEQLKDLTAQRRGAYRRQHRSLPGPQLWHLPPTVTLVFELWAITHAPSAPRTRHLPYGFDLEALNLSTVCYVKNLFDVKEAI